MAFMVVDTVSPARNDGRSSRWQADPNGHQALLSTDASPVPVLFWGSVKDVKLAVADVRPGPPRKQEAVVGDGV